ncbi:phosphopantetheine-binding protein [Fodinicola feengrottensis]|uniref:Carrier domain-containing protein n=1 Tax=Fodinicola feengrottensis TaxID=435914 RepID=A0ABP4RN01_9ACTN|nr:phosphopantetheine-binding protein [Fodinicola feengrottensis]
MTSQDQVEQLVIDVWQAALRVADIDINDDFFARGGHSVQAMAVVTALRERLAIELPVSLIFEASTVAEFAAEIRRVLANKQQVP